jgi:HlyD family secretion protein
MSQTTPESRTPRPDEHAAPTKDVPKAPDRPAWSRRWLVPAALALLAAGAGGYLWSEPYETHLILQGNIDVRQVNLAFKVDGRIAELNVDEGDSAYAGQVVASLDKVYFQDELRLARARRDNAKANLLRLEHGSRPEEIAQAKATVAERKATLTQAQEELARGRRLIRGTAIAREELERLRSASGEALSRLRSAEEALRLAEIGPRQEDIDAARAELRTQEASVIQTERRLIYSDLIAPSNGVILTRAREKGAIVAAGETVFTLTLASPVWVRTYVNERDLGRIRPDLPAEVRTDSAPDKVYRGTIGFISPTAEFTPKTVETRELRTDLVYRLRVVVEDPDGGLRQGMPVTASVELPEPRPQSFWQRLREALPWAGSPAEPGHGR